MAQHVLQDAAVLEVFELVERIDAADQRNSLERAVRRNDLGNQPLARFQVTVGSIFVEKPDGLSPTTSGSGPIR